MSSPSRLLPALAAMSLAMIGLTACGSTGDGPDATNPVVAQIGGARITRSTLNHWMSSIVGGDYYESLLRRAPKGLVSDPPNYAACASAIETIGPPTSAAGSSKAIRTELEGKCRELYSALRQQALTFLISEVWSVDVDAEYGIKVTNEEIKQVFEKLKAEQFPSKAAFATYLANHRWTLSDELDLVKRDLLTGKLEAALERKLGKTGHKPNDVQKAYLTLYEENVKKYTAKTICRAGYLAPDCKQYKAPAHEPPSPDILLEQIAASR